MNKILSHAKAQRRKACRLEVSFFAFSLRLCAFAREILINK